MSLLKKSQFAYDDSAISQNRAWLLSLTKHVVSDDEIVVTLNVKCKKAQALITAFNLTINSGWFDELSIESSRESYRNAIRNLIEYVNKINKKITIEILSVFQAVEVEERGIVPQSSSSKKVLTLLRKSLYSDEFKGADRRFIYHLVNKTRLAKPTLPVPFQMASWFSKHPWIRSVLGTTYERIASPKRLMRSFQTSVAFTLIQILESKRHLFENKDLHRKYSQVANHPHSNKFLQRSIGELLEMSHKTNSDNPHILQEVLTIECIKPAHNEVIKTDISNGLIDFTERLKPLRQNYPYKRPFVFNSNEPSQVEELLLYWLMCSLAVQPSDALELRRANFTVHKNSRNRERYIAMDYIKGRGAKEHEPPMLFAGEIMFDAVKLYLDMLPFGRDNLFSSEHNKVIAVSNPYSRHNNISAQTAWTFLVRFWVETSARRSLKPVLQREGTDYLFLDALLAFHSDEVPSYGQWITITGGDKTKTYYDYLTANAKTLPQHIFSGAHIKNSSVYSRTDKYREDDLFTVNSHSSLTEKTSYLTDHNQEWKNQVGRISRIVMQDIELHSLAPNKNLVDAEAQERRVLTKIKAATESDSVKVNNIGIETIQEDGELGAQIVVESVGNAVNMLHYISQAEAMYKRLRDYNLPYLEDVLINVEWMDFCLDNFNHKTISLAEDKYKKVGHLMPDLFTNEVRGSIEI